ncbi:c-type cytochrome [Campylobacter jejuni]
MYRLIKAASYIKENMLQGAPDLSLEDAYDVAAYMNSQARPIKANRDKDFPDRKVEPLDMDLMTIAFLQPNIAMDLIQI